MSTTNKKVDGVPHQLDEERLILKMRSQHWRQHQYTSCTSWSIKVGQKISNNFLLGTKSWWRNFVFLSRALGKYSRLLDICKRKCKLFWLRCWFEICKSKWLKCKVLGQKNDNMTTQVKNGYLFSRKYFTTADAQVVITV